MPGDAITLAIEAAIESVSKHCDEGIKNQEQRTTKRLKVLRDQVAAMEKLTEANVWRWGSNPGPAVSASPRDVRSVLSLLRLLLETSPTP